MPCLLNDKLSLWAARSVEPLRRLVKRRNLNSLCQLLGTLGGGECLDDGAELITQKDAQRRAVTAFGKTP